MIRSLRNSSETCFRKMKIISPILIFTVLGVTFAEELKDNIPSNYHDELKEIFNGDIQNTIKNIVDDPALKETANLNRHKRAPATDKQSNPSEEKSSEKAKKDRNKRRLERQLKESEEIIGRHKNLKIEKIVKPHEDSDNVTVVVHREKVDDQKWKKDMKMLAKCRIDITSDEYKNLKRGEALEKLLSDECRKFMTSLRRERDALTYEDIKRVVESGQSKRKELFKSILYEKDERLKKSKRKGVGTAGLSKRSTLTDDQTCGPNVDKYCDPGRCCSGFGWCGEGFEYCTYSCQDGYGDCDDTGATPNPTPGGDPNHTVDLEERAGTRDHWLNICYPPIWNYGSKGNRNFQYPYDYSDWEPSPNFVLSQSNQAVDAVLDYWGEGVCAPCSGSGSTGFGNAYNVNHQYQCTSSAYYPGTSSARTKIPNRIPLNDYTDTVVNRYIAPGSFSRIYVESSPIELHTATDIFQIISRPISRDSLFVFFDAGVYVNYVSNCDIVARSMGFSRAYWGALIKNPRIIMPEVEVHDSRDTISPTIAWAPSRIGMSWPERIDSDGRLEQGFCIIDSNDENMRACLNENGDISNIFIDYTSRRDTIISTIKLASGKGRGPYRMSLVQANLNVFDSYGFVVWSSYPPSTIYPVPLTTYYYLYNYNGHLNVYSDHGYVYTPTIPQ